MGHSVEGHLKLNVADYDRLIRQLVPGYSAMRETHMALLRKLLPADRRTLVLDLGGGTGALAEAVAETLPQAEVEIWDIDRAMLGVARERCARFGDRVRYVERSFTAALTPCDAVVACIALHHVKDLAVKGAIYRNIFAALKPGGAFLNADTAIAAGGRLREFSYQEWIDAMAPHGISEPEARAHFASWAREDYYPPLMAELRLVQDAGFADPECFWRGIPFLIFGGIK
ncbi:MAG TPA: class I SAM-dependent methyltransferase [Lacunisphaera sp.]|nr:class I SAM-dependent methyltransferase [Lacunisphaera sp.]